MEINHFSHRHPLILTEVVETDGEKGVICSGCEESVLGPGYKCYDCNFLLHKSCTELPMEIQHPFHPNHALSLKKPHQTAYCDACDKKSRNCFFYYCKSCSLHLDIKCASQGQINASHSHQHVFIPILKHIQFTCEACGEESKCGRARLCSICQLLVHTKCTRFPRTIEIAAHNHSLAHTYSLRQGKELPADNVFCRLCYKKINPNYAAYYCQECDYVAHTVCTYDYYVFVGPLKEGKEAESGFEVINLKGDEEAGEIKHFSHQHNLVLNCEALKDEKLCEGCRLLISGPFYSCEQCSFFLHDRCAKLPTKKRHPIHPHQLTLFSRDLCVFRCHACDQRRPGFSYECEDCGSFNLDVQCYTIPEELKHEGHQHSLYLAISSTEICNGCHISWISGRVFVCTECNFAVCFRCATLPLMIKHKYDKHPLKLTYAVDNDSEEYFCVLCEKERNPKHWFYYCAECDFDAHAECVLGRFPYIKWGSTYMYKFHEHPLTYVRKAKYSPPCKSCGVLSEDWFFECDRCKSTIRWSHTCNS